MSGSSTPSFKKSDKRTLYLTRLALITAVMIIMAFTPLGYFRTPFLSVTLMTVPTALGGILFGPLAGAYCGLVFGITSVINAVSAGGLTGMLLLIDPVGAVFTMVVPRVLDGLLSALIFWFFRTHKMRKTGIFAASLACPLLNTLLFMSFLLIIFYDSEYIRGLASSFGSTDPFMFIAAFVGIQGVTEALICFLVTSLISFPLLRVVSR